jgi:hypothetical protein
VIFLVLLPAEFLALDLFSGRASFLVPRTLVSLFSSFGDSELDIRTKPDVLSGHCYWFRIVIAFLRKPLEISNSSTRMELDLRPF